MEYVNPQAAEKLVDYQLPQELKEHLIKAHQWGDEFADQVLKEYWRYIQMLAVTKGMLAPSQTVAQVLQAHQKINSSNWRALNILLVKPLHNGVERRKDDQKHLVVYLKTLQDYRETFKESPPIEIWEDPIQEELDRNNRLLVIIPVVVVLSLVVAFFNGANMILALMAILSFGGLAFLYVSARNDKARKMGEYEGDLEISDLR